MQKNDPLLTVSPFSVAPDTWELNGLYLDVLEDYTRRWSGKGYSWKHGLELNFSMPMHHKTAEDIAAEQRPQEERDEDKRRADILRPRLLKNYPRAQITRDICEGMPFVSELDDFYRDAAAGLKAYVAQNGPGDAFFREAGFTPREVIAELESYEAARTSEDEETRLRAARSLCLAHLHLMPQTKGGFADLILPRFGNYSYGLGWFDEGENDCEIRTIPEANPFAFIANYTRILNTLVNTSRNFGVQAKPEYTHQHYSLWHDATGRNVMQSNRFGDIRMRARMLQGLTFMKSAIPGVFTDFRTSGYDTIFNLNADSSRSSDLRQTQQTWESRYDKGSWHIHLARDTALVMATTYAGVYMRTPKGKSPFAQITVKPSRRLEVTDSNTQHMSALRSTFEHCAVDKTGALKASHGALYWNRERLIEELGPDNVGLHKDGENDLSKLEGWKSLIGLLRADRASGRLILPEGTDPELASYLGQVRIDGTRVILTTSFSSGLLGFNAYMHAPHYLKKSVIVRTMFGRDGQKKLAGFYDDYKFKKMKQVAHGFTFFAGILMEDADADQSQIYANVWAKFIMPSITQLILDEKWQRKKAVGDEENFPAVMTRKKLLKRKTVIGPMAAGFDEAADEEIAARKALGKNVNAQVAFQEDLRRDVGHFAENPASMFHSGLDGIAHFLCEEAATMPPEDLPQFGKRLASFNANIVQGFFALCLGEEKGDPAQVRSIALASTQRLAGMFAQQEEKTPDLADKPAYVAARDEIMEAHEKAISATVKMADSFMLGKRAVLTLRQ